MPASAQECAASATSEADPVTTAAIDLATAMSRFAANATMTVTRLSEPTVFWLTASSRSVCGMGRARAMLRD